VGCKVAADCEAKLPQTTPAGCAEAACEAGACVFRARDKDGDGDRAKFCKDAAGVLTVEVGTDCDDTDKTRHPGAWDGPEGEGKAASCDGVDNDCSGTADDAVLADGTSCACKPGATQACAQTSAGKAIPELAGGEVGECRYGAQKCVIDDATGIGKWGPCTGAIGPTAEECNLKDDDCNGTPDDVSAGLGNYCPDADSDGFCDLGKCQQACPGTLGAGWREKSTCSGALLNQTDCNDDLAQNGEFFHPGAERCVGDGNDYNCNGTGNKPGDGDCECTTGEQGACGSLDTCNVGERTCEEGGAWGPCSGGVAIEKVEFCDDIDGDNFCNLQQCGQLFCPTDGPVKKKRLSQCPIKTDCNDEQIQINPGQQEQCVGDGLDYNCNGVPNSEKPGDCSCVNDTKYPCGSADTCNDGGQALCTSGQLGLCDHPPLVKQLYCRDADGDQHCTTECADLCPNGDLTGWRTETTCVTKNDCNDASGLVNPAAGETCNDVGVDNDCNGDSAEAGNKLKYYCDKDSDGYVDKVLAAVVTVDACSKPEPGTQGCVGQWLDAPSSGDCNDADQATYPGAPETCGNVGVDNDCDGDAAESSGTVTYYCDPDNDGFLDKNQASVATYQGCSAPPTGTNGCAGTWRGPGTPFSDCAEGNPAINPNALEICEAAMVDENCSGAGNEGCNCVNNTKQTCWETNQGAPIPHSGNNGIGACKSGEQLCTNGQWGICTGGIGPTADVCIQKQTLADQDEDCNGTPDDNNAYKATWIYDYDGDGFLDNNSKLSTLSCFAPTTCPAFDKTFTCGKIDEKLGGANSVPKKVIVGCPAGSTISAVTYASYGTPVGTCPGTFTNGSCTAANSKTVVDKLCLGKQSCRIDATNLAQTDDASVSFGDPCPGTAKFLAVQVQCSAGCDLAGWKPVGAQGGDCFDGAVAIKPGATEICGDNFDSNCNGNNNDTCGCNPGDVEACWTGAAGVTFAAPGNTSVCVQGSRSCQGSGQWGNCVGQTLPSSESCDGKDNDCNGLTDDVPSAPTWYCDKDNDGHAASNVTPVKQCSAPASGCTAVVGGGGWKQNLALVDDCDDTAPSVYTGAPELCTATNENCKSDGYDGWTWPNGQPFGAACNNGLQGSCYKTGTNYCASSSSALCSAGTWGDVPYGGTTFTKTLVHGSYDVSCDGKFTYDRLVPSGANVCYTKAGVCGLSCDFGGQTYWNLAGTSVHAPTGNDIVPAGAKFDSSYGFPLPNCGTQVAVTFCFYDGSSWVSVANPAVPMGCR
jgi:hypothetical protein